MTTPDSATLRLVYSPTNIVPGFVVPVFEAAKEFFVLDGRVDGAIEGFQEWSLADLIGPDVLKWMGPPLDSKSFDPAGSQIPLLRASEKGDRIVPANPHALRVFDFGARHRLDWTTCEVGQPMRLCYATTTLEVFFGSSREIRTMLRNSYAGVPPFPGPWDRIPFSGIDVAEFVGDRKQYERAVDQAATLMQGDDVTIAKRWRQFMLSADISGESKGESAGGASG